MKHALYALLLSLTVLGCEASRKPALFDNPDPRLRKTMEEFAADARQRHPYPTNAPRVASSTPVARAQVHYGMIKKIDIRNLTSDPIQNVEVWVDRRFVCFLPEMEPGIIKRIDFRMLFDADGNAYAVTPTRPVVERVELLVGGKLHQVPVQFAD